MTSAKLHRVKLRTVAVLYEAEGGVYQLSLCQMLVYSLCGGFDNPHQLGNTEVLTGLLCNFKLSCHVVRCHVTWYDVMSRCMMSCHVVWCHVTWYDVMSRDVILNHVILSHLSSKEGKRRKHALEKSIRCLFSLHRTLAGQHQYLSSSGNLVLGVLQFQGAADTLTCKHIFSLFCVGLFGV